MIKVSELKHLEVINITDGKRLGNLRDIDIDLEQGRIRSLILPGFSERGGGWFSRNEDFLVVDWSDVVLIGVDIILLELV